MNSKEVARVRYEGGCECEHNDIVTIHNLTLSNLKWMKHHEWTNDEIICTMLNCGCDNDMTDSIEIEAEERGAEKAG